MHACIHACTGVCTYVCMYVGKSVCNLVSQSVRMSVSLFICLYSPLRVYIHASSLSLSRVHVQRICGCTLTPWASLQTQHIDDKPQLAIRQSTSAVE